LFRNFSFLSNNRLKLTPDQSPRQPNNLLNKPRAPAGIINRTFPARYQHKQSSHKKGTTARQSAELKKRPAFAGPALEAIGGIVIWEGNYTANTPFSALLPIDFSDFFNRLIYNNLTPPQKKPCYFLTFKTGMLYLYGINS
jgi:hypothetical protein